MNVLFITHYADLYGANKSLLDLIDGFKNFDNNFNCSVIVSRNGPMVNELKKRNIKIYRTLYTNDVYIERRSSEILRIPVKLLLNLVSFIILICRIKRSQFDLVHTNSSITYLGIFLSKWFRKKHVWHIREFAYDAFHFKYLGGNAFFQHLLNKSYSIAISQAVLMKILNRIPSDRKIVLEDGVIWEKDLKQNPCFLNDVSNIVFGMVGYISEIKNQKEALLAFGLYHEKYSGTLYLIGDGNKEYINDLKSLSTSLNVYHDVHFAGFISNILDFYKNIDVLLMCTKNEALGRVTIEAMSQGIPCIGYDNAGTSELIKDNINGFLYENGSEDLCSKMAEIRNEVLYLQMSEEAIDSASKFTIENYASKLWCYYQKILNNL